MVVRGRSPAVGNRSLRSIGNPYRRPSCEFRNYATVGGSGYRSLMAIEDGSAETFETVDPRAKIEELRASIGTAVKPRLRGWLHFGAGPLAFLLALRLVLVESY